MLDYYEAVKFMFSRTPAHFIFFVTARCQYRCRHCFYWEERDRVTRELNLEEIRSISRGLPQIKLLSLTGGEPFLRDDLTEIAEIFCSHNDVHHLVVHTNGSLPAKAKEFCEHMMKSFPDLSLAISISLDGTGEEHDWIRGKKGAYGAVTRTVRGLQSLRKNFPNFEVEITTVVSLHNVKTATRIVDEVAKDKGVDCHSVELVRGNTQDPAAGPVEADQFKQIIQYKNMVRKERVKTDYPLSSFRKVIDILTPEIEAETMKREKMLLPCTAGRRVVVMAESGDLYPCELLGRSFGNVRDNGYDIPGMLFSEKGREIKRFIKSSRCFCSWGCAVSNNLIFNLRAYPRILFRWVRNFRLC